MDNNNNESALSANNDPQQDAPQADFQTQEQSQQQQPTSITEAKRLKNQ